MEQWKLIGGYNNHYKISTLGRVKSCTSGKWKLIKIQKNPVSNYAVFTLRKNGIPSSKTVHRLVATAFIPNPENKPCVNHINNIRDDNRVENLEWCRHKENMQWCIQQGRFKFNKSGNNGRQSKLNSTLAEEIRYKVRINGTKPREIAKEYNISYSCIYDLMTGRSWRKV